MNTFRSFRTAIHRLVPLTSWTSSLVTAALASLALAGAAAAAPIAFIKQEAPLWYFQGTAHIDTGGALHFHVFRSDCPAPPAPVGCFVGRGPGGCAFWQSPFEIGEAEPRTVQLRGESEHVFAPHPADGQCAEVFTYRTAVSVPQNGVIRDVRFFRTLTHGPHLDIHGVALAAFSINRPGGFEKRGYVHSSIGVHRRDKVPGLCSVMSGSSQVPPDTDAAVGCMIIVPGDVGNSTVDLFAIVDEIPPQKITSSGIFLGLAGQIGPLVFDLGPGANWLPFGQGGSYLALHEVPFPAGFIPMLQGGHCYASIATADLPGGAIRGQIEEPPAVVGVDAGGPSGGRYIQSLNTPNPFTRSTEVNFALGEPMRVSLKVYDAAGRLVKTLVDGVSLGAGDHRVEWDGSGSDGSRARAGIYFYRLQIGSRAESRRMIFVK